jgi:NADH-quinone oxidoreductase subunit C
MHSAAHIAELLQPDFPGAAIDQASSVDQPTLLVPLDHLAAITRALRDHLELRFTLVADLTAVDFFPREPRFELVYHLVSPSKALRLRLKARVPGDAARAPTLIDVWPACNWLEREVWDMFGIVFDGHPDLRRLLMPDDWEGHPLRKDYPVQIRMAAKTFQPLQLSEEEFRANLRADWAARDRDRR